MNANPNTQKSLQAGNLPIMSCIIPMRLSFRLDIIVKSLIEILYPNIDIEFLAKPGKGETS